MAIDQTNPELAKIKRDTISVMRGHGVSDSDAMLAWDLSIRLAEQSQLTAMNVVTTAPSHLQALVAATGISLLERACIEISYGFKSAVSDPSRA